MDKPQALAHAHPIVWAILIVGGTLSWYAIGSACVWLARLIGG